MNFADFSMNLTAQKNNEIAVQYYEFSCPNLRQPYTELGFFKLANNFLKIFLGISFKN
jgi:hypothetical protein